MLEVEYFQKQALVYFDKAFTFSLPDKKPVTIRALQQSDAVLLMEMHDRLSNESIYYRYLGANKPTIKDLQQVCSSNGEAGMAVIATIEDPHEKVIALAYYRVEQNDPSTAEPAIIVEDQYQGCGLGKQMVIALYKMAVQDGLTSFDTFVHPGNYRIIQMIKSSGLQFVNTYCDGMKKIRIWL